MIRQLCGTNDLKYHTCSSKLRTYAWFITRTTCNCFTALNVNSRAKQSAVILVDPRKLSSLPTVNLQIQDMWFSWRVKLRLARTEAPLKNYSLRGPNRARGPSMDKSRIVWPPRRRRPDFAAEEFNEEVKVRNRQPRSYLPPPLSSLPHPPNRGKHVRGPFYGPQGGALFSAPLTFSTHCRWRGLLWIFKGVGLNSRVPDVQVLLQPGWLPFDPQLYSSTSLDIKDGKDADSQSSLDPPYDLTPLTMTKTTPRNSRLMPFTSAAQRQSMLERGMVDKRLENSKWNGIVRGFYMWIILKIDLSSLRRLMRYTRDPFSAACADCLN